jgi:hypothetical protein
LQTGAAVTISAAYSLCAAIGVTAANGVANVAASGTANYSVINSVVQNCTTGVLNGAGDTVTHTYNDYYNNETNAFEALDATDWETAAGIVLLDPPPLAERQWEALAAWLAPGRGLVVWHGPAAGGSGFNPAGSRRVLGGEVVRV